MYEKANAAAAAWKAEAEKWKAEADFQRAEASEWKDRLSLAQQRATDASLAQQYGNSQPSTHSAPTLSSSFDTNGVPPAVVTEIRAKYEQKYAGECGLQETLIKSELESYRKMHGG